jgi:hypothetical protein
MTNRPHDCDGTACVGIWISCASLLQTEFQGSSNVAERGIFFSWVRDRLNGDAAIAQICGSQGPRKGFP